jgi:hypothetical protein
MIDSSNNKISISESFCVKKDEAGGTAGSENSPRDALHLLNSILELSDQRKVSAPQIMIILDALAAAQDPALVSRFPAVLAICGRRGIELSSSNLLGRYWETNPRRQNLEKLLYISAELLRRESMAAPFHLRQIAESLKARHAALAAADYVQLAGGPMVAVADMLSALRQFAGERPPSRKPPSLEISRSGSDHLGGQLKLLFSEKQKELIFKKVKQRPMTKTEREYYSRVVKKKLAAIAAPEVQELATALTQAGKRKDP